MDDIVYGAPLGPRVTMVKPLDNYVLETHWNNGETRLFDAKPLLAYKAFQRLKNPAFFAQATVCYGSVCWPDDIDYCPDRLYEQSVPTT